MDTINESTINLILSALMGVFGGLVTMPINALIFSIAKRDELQYQHKLNIIAKQRELLLQHKLEMKSKEQNSSEIADLKTAIKRLEQRIGDN